ncbi:alpha-N-acetylgalactosaminide alpha-2,6-sialyltransferase 3 isoform X2 [Gambusia affinis]|uniref:alpha-N-acetylgalactosaminide alpha-2,6-sialyltransferase 3 isoform X2 n=1 Tax=Gambusia affinis TaxID=33528 RepID=UPI001CDC8870|nr:alpha-N-acetylgalactosaminide alpha-2,6-sialyltransferase 3 isoform X2 [Gambusia affinis]
MAWMWKKKSLIATSLIVVVSLFVVVVNFSQMPDFGQTFSNHWMFSKQSYKAFKPHLGYVSIPKQEPLKLNCELCSIVSSSGQMLGQAAGAQIDRSPCIWRMNNAPTRGFENDVGRRTTLRVVSHTSVPLLLQKPQHFFGQGNDTLYVVWGPLRNMRKDGKGIVYNMLRQASENYPHARIYATTEDRMNYCDMVFKKETGKDSVILQKIMWFVRKLSRFCREQKLCHYEVQKERQRVAQDGEEIKNLFKIDVLYVQKQQSLIDKFTPVFGKERERVIKMSKCQDYKKKTENNISIALLKKEQLYN